MPKVFRRLQDAAHFKQSLAGLRFVNFVKCSIEIVVCIDETFPVNHHKSSQLRILVMATDKQNGNFNIIRFISSKSKRVYKSVLGSDWFAFVDGFDIGYSIADALGAMLDRKVDLNMYADSQSLYGSCTSLEYKTERYLQIDLSLIREDTNKEKFQTFVDRGKLQPRR